MLAVSTTASEVRAGRGVLLAVVLLVEGVADLGMGECVGLARESVSRGDGRRLRRGAHLRRAPPEDGQIHAVVSNHHGAQPRVVAPYEVGRHGAALARPLFPL